MCLCMYVWLSTDHVYSWLDTHFEYKVEQIFTDPNISESDQHYKIANTTSTLIFRTLQNTLRGVETINLSYSRAVSCQ